MALPMIRLEGTDFHKLAEEFRKLPKSLAARTMAAAAKRAMQPAVPALKQTTPVGPTGNLRRGIMLKSVAYSKSGHGVAIAGYRKSSTKDPGVTKGGRKKRSNTLTFHQFLVEFGTKPRRNRRGAYRGIMRAMHPVKRASEMVSDQVRKNMEKEMTVGLERAGRELQTYMAKRAAAKKYD